MAISIFPIRQLVSCHNGSDGEISISHTGSPTFGYLWLSGAPVIDQQHLAPTPASYQPLANQWQSFTAGKDGFLDAVSLLVEVRGGVSAQGAVMVHPGSGTRNSAISFHDFELSPTSGPQLHRIDLLGAPYMQAGQVYTLAFYVYSGTINAGIEDPGTYANGSGSIGVSDFLFQTEIVENTPGNTFPGSTVLTGLSPAKYNVLVTDGTGDTGFTGIQLPNPEPLQIIPVIVQNPTNPVTYDGRIAVNVIGGSPPLVGGPLVYSYVWDNGETGSSISSLGNGNYNLEVRDGRNCLETAAFALTSMMTSVPSAACDSRVISAPLVVAKGNQGYFVGILDENENKVLEVKMEESTLQDVVEMTLGGVGKAGEIVVKGQNCRDAICLDGSMASIVAGCEFLNGQIVVRDERNNDLILLDGKDAEMALGGTEWDGSLRIFPKQGEPDGMPGIAAFDFDAQTGNLDLNGNGLDGGKIWISKDGSKVIGIDGDRIELEITNADFAEDFDLAPAPELGWVEPGMVMVLNQNAKLVPCSAEYDKKVAGVISGAGKFRPGIVMDKKSQNPDRKPIALAGKTYCFAEALENQIEPGDLLTTSPVRGHARKANEPLKAVGAVIGKAMKGLEKGKTGLIPIKVGLK